MMGRLEDDYEEKEEERLFKEFYKKLYIGALALSVILAVVNFTVYYEIGGEFISNLIEVQDDENEHKSKHANDANN